MTLKDKLTYEPVELSFGTSGLRGLVTDMTDLEVYANTAGFIEFLKKVGDGNLRSIAVAGDLRFSTPKIIKAVSQAVYDKGMKIDYCGYIPTPAISDYALRRNMASIMVTGSHIPDNRNGIKYVKTDGEVLKSDEEAIKSHVSKVRKELYCRDIRKSQFDENGEFKKPVDDMPKASETATQEFTKRNNLPGKPLKGLKVAVYQHSAVGRDILNTILKKNGADVIPVGRSDKFVPIDTEYIGPEYVEYFRSVISDNPGIDAIVSTDGDSDRPIVVDERGKFHRGDELGVLVAAILNADFGALPITANDAVVDYAERNKIVLEFTKIGSPYVISSMHNALAKQANRVVGWEVNGGFLTASDVTLAGKKITPLPTRDAFLPILAVLQEASKRKVHLSQLFSELPKRHTEAGLINDFDNDLSRQIVSKLGCRDKALEVICVDFMRSFVRGVGVETVNNLDGARIVFTNKDIIHIRPSGNAPQLRIYSVSSSPRIAKQIVFEGIAPEGLLRKLELAMTELNITPLDINNNMTRHEND